MDLFLLHVLPVFQFFLLNKIKRILHRSQIAAHMRNCAYGTLALSAPCNGNNVSSAHDAEYHLALALRCVEAFIQEECNVEDDHAALKALAEMQAQADVQSPEP